MRFAIIAIMPEGPSIIMLKEAIAPFNRKKILTASGNAKIDMHRLENKTIREIKTWGKHLLICFDGFFLRIHLLMFGTYLINEEKKTPLKLGLKCKKGMLNFYTCSIVLVEGNPDDVYDWAADIMNKQWSVKNAMNKLAAAPDVFVCDVLLDQTIFSGLGNIIRNEILFITGIHPESKTGNIPAARTKVLLQEAATYSFEFLKWKKAGTLNKHWQAYSKKICPRCNIPVHKAYPGKTRRRIFFCNNCQLRY